MRTRHRLVLSTTPFLVCVWPMFHNYSAAHSAVRHWAKQFDKLHQRLAIVQNRLDASSSMVIVNWTLCITFGIFILFGHWAVYFVTLVRVWKAPWRTGWNECRIVLQICHSLRTMLKVCSMTNWNPIRRLATHICQSLCTNSERCAEFCSCVQTVLTICHLQLQKGVLPFDVTNVGSSTLYYFALFFQ